jgi:hypothetical protein
MLTLKTSVAVAIAFVLVMISSALTYAVLFFSSAAPPLAAPPVAVPCPAPAPVVACPPPVTCPSPPRRAGQTVKIPVDDGERF